MSGVFWEPEKQPDLTEAASVFTLSTVNLAVAIPMAVVDLLVSVTLFLSTTLWTLLGPVMEYLMSGLVMLMEAAGLDRPSPEQTIVFAVGVSTVATVYKQYSGKSQAKQKIFSALLTTHLEGWLLVYSFLALPALDKAVYANVILLALSIQLAKFCIAALFKGFYNHALQRKQNEMDKIASGMMNALGIESSLALMVAAFGYPSFSSSDPVTAYLCLVPAVALQLVLRTEILPNVCPEDVTDSPNGEAVAVAETKTAEEKAVQPQEPAESTASDEVVPEATAEADGSSVETIEDKNTEAMIRRLQGCVAGLYSWLSAKVLAIISPVCQLVSRVISCITSLPWACISHFTFTKLSTLLWAFGWYHLTSNNLCVLLPICSLLIPPALEKITAIPTGWQPYLAQMNGLVYSVVQCLVIVGGAGDTLE